MLLGMKSLTIFEVLHGGKYCHTFSKHKFTIAKLIVDNQDVFALSELELGRNETVQLHINTEENPPAYTKHYHTLLN